MIVRARDDIMGMPITVAIAGTEFKEKKSFDFAQEKIDEVFNFFQKVDERFSTFKKMSEISRFNRGEVEKKDLTEEMKLIFKLAEKTKKETNGFFDIQKADDFVDPSGIVKGWAISVSAKKLKKMGFKNFFIEAGGDIQTEGLNLPAGRQDENGEKWKVGIKNPFKKSEIVKVLKISGMGVATSGTYEKGEHIYNPLNRNSHLNKIVSLTVIADDILDADRFATAAFAMQEKGIEFIQSQKNLEGYAIDKNGIATMTNGFEKYVQ